MNANADQQGMALLMVLVMQLVLSLLATSAFQQAMLQQKMTANAWLGMSDRIHVRRALHRLEMAFLGNGLEVSEQAVLGIAPNDCGLAGWLQAKHALVPWKPFGTDGLIRYSYAVVRWQPQACVPEGAGHVAHSLVLKAQHPNDRVEFLQSMWSGDIDLPVYRRTNAKGR